jgi:hypothetical protein
VRRDKTTGQSSKADPIHAILSKQSIEPTVLLFTCPSAKSAVFLADGICPGPTLNSSTAVAILSTLLVPSFAHVSSRNVIVRDLSVAALSSLLAAKSVSHLVELQEHSVGMRRELRGNTFQMSAFVQPPLIMKSRLFGVGIAY